MILVYLSICGFLRSAQDAHLTPSLPPSLSLFVLLIQNCKLSPRCFLLIRSHSGILLTPLHILIRALPRRFDAPAVLLSPRSCRNHSTIGGDHYHGLPLPSIRPRLASAPWLFFRGFSHDSGLLRSEIIITRTAQLTHGARLYFTSPFTASLPAPLLPAFTCVL